MVRIQKGEHDRTRSDGAVFTKRLFLPYLDLAIKGAACNDLAIFWVSPDRLEDGRVVCFPGVVEFPSAGAIAFNVVPDLEALVGRARHQSFAVEIVRHVVDEVFVGRVEFGDAAHAE